MKVYGSSSEFQLHPDGQHPAICIDVIDRGEVETTFGKKHKLTIRYFCGHRSDSGDILWVDQWFTASLHSKSALRKHLRTWRGTDVTDDEVRKGFDLDRLVGAPCLLSVTHNASGERTYANVESIMRLPSGMTAPSIPSGYERVDYQEPDHAGKAPTPAPPPAPEHKHQSTNRVDVSTEPIGGLPPDNIPF